MITLQITRKVKNDAYEEEMKEVKSNRIYGMDNRTYPTPELVQNILTVEITEAQFEAIRKEVLKNF